MDYLDDFIDFIEFIENDDDLPIQIRIPKRYIRDMNNPLDFYSEKEFKTRYRFSKMTVQETILPLINNHLIRNDNRGLPITPLQQLFVALRFYATGSFQIVGGDLQGISQPSISLIVKKVSQLIAGLLEQFVKFPDDPQEHQMNVQKFFQIANFPGISCCIDGTHILIKNPGGEIGEVFRNRKGQFSLNVQVACGPSMEILDIVARYPGSFHDNVIFERSSLKIRYENNTIEGKILGDNGYACKRYLLTPVINPTTRAENNYNTAHKRTRNLIERCFGVLKQRFQCLRRGLAVKLESSVAVICVVAVLHNIAIRNYDEIEEEYVNGNEVGYVENIIDNPNANGIHYRRAFIVAHFGN